MREMEYDFSKSKIPKGLSYPLKRSLLDKAFEEYEISQIFVVYYFLRTGGNIVMRADYHGEGEQNFATGKTTVTVYAVPSEERKRTEDLLVQQGLPALMKWIKNIEISNQGFRIKDRHFVMECKNNELHFRQFE